MRFVLIKKKQRINFFSVSLPQDTEEPDYVNIPKLKPKKEKI